MDHRRQTSGIDGMGDVCTCQLPCILVFSGLNVAILAIEVVPSWF